MFAVFRGKVAEGLNFVNDLARLVVVIGLPYSNRKEARIELKERFQDEVHARDPLAMQGWDWYEEEAVRAVN